MGNKLKILCVGAHPDDVEIGMGGTVLSMRERGYEILVLDLSNGEPTPQGSVPVRLKEAENSAKLMGVHRKILGMPNRYILDSIENRMSIAGEIRLFQPDYVFAPWIEDGHPDHVAAGHLVESARFYAKLSKTDLPGEPCYPRRVIFYFPIHIRLRREPSFVNDIGKYIEKKREAILCYESQFIKTGKELYIENIVNENRYWGFQSGFSYAEPFIQKEMIAFPRWPEGYH